MFGRHHIGPTLDALAAPASLDAFAASQAQLRETARARGLDQGNAVFIGTGGLAMHGLYAHVDLGPETPRLDGDAFVDDPTFQRLQAADGADARPAHNPSEVHLPASGDLLAVDGLVTPLTDDMAYNFSGARSFADLAKRAKLATPEGSVLALPPHELASGKMRRGDLKDAAGIAQAHFLAWATDHAVASKPLWQWDVVGACNILERRAATSRSFRRALPIWLGVLVASRFDHPAFRLDPDIRVLSRAS
jgi:hypothetical protein